MCPPLLILNGLAMQHELQRHSFLPFTGPIDGEEAQAKVSVTILMEVVVNGEMIRGNEAAMKRQDSKRN